MWQNVAVLTDAFADLLFVSFFEDPTAITFPQRFRVGVFCPSIERLSRNLPQLPTMKLSCFAPRNAFEKSACLSRQQSPTQGVSDFPSCHSLLDSSGAAASLWRATRAKHPTPSERLSQGAISVEDRAPEMRSGNLAPVAGRQVRVLQSVKDQSRCGSESESRARTPLHLALAKQLVTAVVR